MAALATIPVRRPRWHLSYQGMAITTRIESMVRSVKYTSKLAGDASEMEIEVEDRDRKWQGPWLPQRGDRVSLMIGYGGEALADCGHFQIDEVELDDSPEDVVHMRCVAAYITPAMRTANTVGWENQSLPAIAAAIAAKYGLTVVGAPAVTVNFARVTQRQETDLAFLKRLAEESNYEFSVRGNKLVFYARPVLEAQAPVLTIQRSHLTRFRAKTQTETHQVYSAAQVSWLDPASKSLVTATVQADTPVPTGDTLVIRRRMENGAQAAMYARSALHQLNMLQTTGTIAAPGETLFAAGSNVMLSGWGSFDGKYQIREAHHTMTREAGWGTEMEVRRVA